MKFSVARRMEAGVGWGAAGGGWWEVEEGGWECGCGVDGVGVERAVAGRPVRRRSVARGRSICSWWVSRFASGMHICVCV